MTPRLVCPASPQPGRRPAGDACKNEKTSRFQSTGGPSTMTRSKRSAATQGVKPFSGRPQFRWVGGNLHKAWCQTVLLGPAGTARRCQSGWFEKSGCGSWSRVARKGITKNTPKINQEDFQPTARSSWPRRAPSCSRELPLNDSVFGAPVQVVKLKVNGHLTIVRLASASSKAVFVPGILQILKHPETPLDPVTLNVSSEENAARPPRKEPEGRPICEAWACNLNERPIRGVHD